MPSFQGEIQVNYDAIDILFEAIVIALTDESSLLAVWLLDPPFDFGDIEPQIIGASSPFSDSNSILAGSGFLTPLTANKVEKILPLFTTDGHLGFEILHFEIEFQGSVQFAAYDHFCAVFFGDQISLELLETLKAREIIEGYYLYS